MRKGVRYITYKGNWPEGHCTVTQTSSAVNQSVQF